MNRVKFDKYIDNTLCTFSSETEDTRGMSPVDYWWVRNVRNKNEAPIGGVAPYSSWDY